MPCWERSRSQCCGSRVSSSSDAVRRRDPVVRGMLEKRLVLTARLKEEVEGEVEKEDRDG